MIKNKYRVVIISPEGYVHSACFREVALLLVSSFKTIGISCDFAINDFSEKRINIILGYHLLDKNILENEIIKKNIRYIPYQLEQLTSNEFVFSKNLKNILENGISVWDYSKENIGFLHEKNIKAEYLPIGYHKDLEIIETISENEKDIDILFYGSIGKRRKDLLDILSKKYNVKVLFGVYGEKRDEFIRRSKIVLNIHHYSSQLLEMVRISYLLNNKIFIISENSKENPYAGLGVEFLPYSDIISKCEYYLKNNQLREKKRKQNYVKFKKNFPMELFLENIKDYLLTI